MFWFKKKLTWDEAQANFDDFTAAVRSEGLESQISYGQGGSFKTGPYLIIVTRHKYLKRPLKRLLRRLKIRQYKLEISKQLGVIRVL